MGKSSVNIYSNIKLDGVSRQGKELMSFCQREMSKAETPEWRKHIYLFMLEWLSPEDYIIAHTSGSTGMPKPIQLKKEHMAASAQKTNQYFNLTSKKTALLCLSANYIAGKMMLVRAFVGGFNLLLVEPNGLPLKPVSSPIDFAAMVPLQVFNSIENFSSDIKKVIIGGGAVSNELKNKLIKLPTEFFETYGMTETVSHVAIRKLEDMNTSFFAMPNVSFELDDRECLKIHAPDVTLNSVITNDIVRLKSNQEFEFVGRYDNIINTGGVKIIPEELEAKLVHKINGPFLISSIKDDRLGEKLVLVVAENLSLDDIDFSELNKFETPRHLIKITQFPLTDTGKIKRLKVKEIISRY